MASLAEFRMLIDSNINIQMNYWAADMTNLDVSKPLFEYLLVLARLFCLIDSFDRFFFFFSEKLGAPGSLHG
jgi:hypothetical protein